MVRRVSSALRALRRRPGSGERGFTLVEILVAMMLVTIVMTGTLAMQITVIQSAGSSRATSAATTIAQSRIEEFRAQPQANLALSGNVVDCFNYDTTATVGGCNGTQTFTRTTNVVASALGGFQMIVQVSWTDAASGPRNIVLTMERNP